MYANTTLSSLSLLSLFPPRLPPVSPPYSSNQLCVRGLSCHVRDLWAHTTDTLTDTDTLTALVEPHGVRMFKVSTPTSLL